MPPGRPKKNAEEKVVVNDDYLDASFILESDKKVVSVSPGIDYILSGGIPEGVFALIKSKPKVGKTTLALKMAAKAQQQHGKIVVYGNFEHRLSKKNLEGIPGLDISPEKFKIISSQKGKILTAEQMFEQTEQALNDFPDCVFIFDSFGTLSSAEEKTKGYGEGYGNLSVRKMEGQFARRVGPVIMVNNAIVIGIAHVAPNINTPGSSTSAGQKTMYALDIELSLKKVFQNGDWMSGSKLIGQKVEVDCITSALGAPGKSYIAWLKYGSGYSDEAEIVQMSQELNLIEKNGSWMSVVGYEDCKAQGMDSMIDKLKDNPKVYDYLNNKIKELLNED